MRPSRTAILVLLLMVPLVPAPAMAQAADTLTGPDPAGDAVLTVPTEDGDAAEPTPAPAPEAIGGPVDLLEARLYGVSPTEFWLGFTVDDFTRPDIKAIGSVSYSVCFQWSGTGAHYRLVVDMAYPTTAAPGATVRPRLDTFLFDRLPAGCDPYAGIEPDGHVARLSPQDVQPVLDMEAGTFDVRLPRIGFESLTADGSQGPVPAKGDTFGALEAHALAAQGRNEYVYDGLTADGTLTLESDTGNSVLRLLAPSSVQVAYGLESYGVPVHGVEVGRFQTVALTVENRLDSPFDAHLNVTTVTGDATKWDARLIPRIPVAAATDAGPTRETITIVVNADDTVAHKDKVRLLVTATDPDHPGVLGATFLDIVAVEPPTKETKTLWFHGTGRPCSTSERWTNTIPDDPMGDGALIEFQGCVAGGQTSTDVGLGGGALSFRPDIPHGRDYWLSTHEPATGSVTLTNLVRTPGNAAESEAQTVVDVTVQILAGPTRIGEATVQDQTIPGTVDFAVDVEDLVLGTGNRHVAAERPLTVRFIVETQDRTFEVCNDQCPQGTQEVHVPGPSGRLFMGLEDSQITLPVVDSEPAGDIINITRSGALMALRQAASDAPRQVFTNPGKAVVFNMTVRNEGVNRDTAEVSVALNQTGWQAEVLPKDAYALDVGESATFNVRLVAPQTAVEGQTLGVKITTSSRLDPEARATVPLSVKVTTGTILEDEDVSDEVRAASVEKEESPSGVLLPTLLVVGLALWTARRRRA